MWQVAGGMCKGAKAKAGAKGVGYRDYSELRGLSIIFSTIIFILFHFNFIIQWNGILAFLSCFLEFGFYQF